MASALREQSTQLEFRGGMHGGLSQSHDFVAIQRMSCAVPTSAGGAAAGVALNLDSETTVRIGSSLLATFFVANVR
jgi:hypothetical protein